MDIEQFRNPPSQYRSAPFWSWNDRLTDAELVRQVRAFHDVGIGGFFMHSRVGLLTPYLSEEWLERVATCVREAERLGMKAWLYDEDSYPSGYAGGFVTSLGAGVRAKSLSHEMTPERPTMREGTVAVFRCKVEDGQPVAAVRDHGLPPDPGEQFLHVLWTLQSESPWYNDTTYIDTLNREAADAFLRITHDTYARLLGDALGSTVPGIFTDEPRLPGGWAWTPALPAEFRARKGYELTDHLPALLLGIGANVAKVRYDYWHVVTALFLENFCKPVYDWCEAHGIALTGHFWEHTFPNPSIMGDFMAPYAYEQVPGIDCLGFRYENRDHPQFGYVPMMKEVGSVAQQLGRPQVLCEAYGGAGWELDFASQKWYWDWHLVFGVNLLCQHLSLYSLRGCRKRDYPPSFRDHQCWWPLYRALGDYVGRMGYALSQGRVAADVLVLHPSESTWMDYDPAGGAPKRTVRDAFWNLTRALTQLKCEYHLGSEWLMAERGRIRKGALCVGKGSYRLVVLPRMRTIRGTTLDLLSRLVEAGGKIVLTAPPPRCVDGAPSRIVERFFKGDHVVRCRPTRAALARCLAELAPPAVTVTDAQGRNIPAIYAHRRILRGRQLLFLASMDGKKTHKATVSVPATGYAERLDAMTGEVHALAMRREEGRCLLDLEFPPLGSHLIGVGRATPGCKPTPAPRPEPKQWITLEPTWTRRRLGPNALVLDLCQHRIGGGAWSERLPVHEAQSRAMEHYGLPWEQGNRGCQFWKAYQETVDPGPKARVKLRYTFQTELSPEAAESLRLVVECGGRFDARVNGKPVAFDGWWRERSFRSAPIGHLVKSGANRVELATPVRRDTELEASFVVGDFALRPEGDGFVLVDEKPTLRTGDWTRQGYPFYVEPMAYEQEVELAVVPSAALLRLGRVDGVVSRVVVNGREAGIVFGEPLEVDVAEHLRVGANAIAIEVYPSLRNLLGPLHHDGPLGDIVGSWHFFKEWTDAYRVIPQGLAGPVRLGLVP